jgi:hypothetical protein
VAASTNLTPEQRTMRAKLAAHARWAKHNPAEGTAPARNGFLTRFERQAEEQAEGELTPQERRRRAEQLLKQYMTGLAFKSSKARKAAA